MEDIETSICFGEEVATLGDRITAAREARGLSQSEFARKLGVKLKTVRNWEDDRTEPRSNKAQMMSGLLGVPFRWLLIGEGDGIPPPLDNTPLAEGVQDILDELRQLRSELSQKAHRIGRIEKRLRSAQRQKNHKNTRPANEGGASRTASF